VGPASPVTAPNCPPHLPPMNVSALQDCPDVDVHDGDSRKCVRARALPPKVQGAPRHTCGMPNHSSRHAFPKQKPLRAERHMHCQSKRSVPGAALSRRTFQKSGTATTRQETCASAARPRLSLGPGLLEHAASCRSLGRRRRRCKHAEAYTVRGRRHAAAPAPRSCTHNTPLHLRSRPKQARPRPPIHSSTSTSACPPFD